LSLAEFDKRPIAFAEACSQAFELPLGLAVCCEDGGAGNAQVKLLLMNFGAQESRRGSLRAPRQTFQCAANDRLNLSRWNAPDGVIVVSAPEA